MTDRIVPLYIVDKQMVQDGLHDLKWFMYSRMWLENITFTYEEGKYIVLHCPETEDMCHLWNHPDILRAVLDYDITFRRDRMPYPYSAQTRYGDFGTWSKL